MVGLSAAETAEALACSVSSANSTLRRARIALEERVGPRAGWSPEAGAVDRGLLERYVRAWEKGDIDGIIALLHDDRLGDDGVGTFLALQALEAKDGHIRVIDHFTAASSHAAFFAGGLAPTLAGTR